MVSSAVAWSLAGVVGAGGAAGTWSYLYFSESQRSSGITGLTFSNVGELNTFTGGKCVDAMLSGYEKTLLNQKDTNSNKWNTIQNKFQNIRGNSRGCASVSWQKQTWSNALWRGIIRYEWLFSKGDETIVVHGFTGTDSFSQQEKHYIFWKARYINRKTGKRAWMTWNKQVDLPATTRPLSHVMLGSPNFQLKDGREKLEYWGFNPDYTKVRKRSIIKSQGQGAEEQPTKVEQFEGKWKWTPGGHHGFSDWSKNLTTVFYHEIPSIRNLVTVKNGSWQSF